MAELRGIDVHAHILTEETMKLLNKEAPGFNLKLTDVDADFGTMHFGAVSYKKFPRGGWDVDKRLADMDKAQYDLQVLSVIPQTVAYDEDPSLALTMSQVQNDQIAALVKKHPDRFVGLGTIPLQSPDAAVTELKRIVGELGLKGVMIGSNVKGRNFDDPALEPVWAAAAELDAFVFIHPTTTAAADRLKDYYLRNFIGNPLDTTIAAASLLYAGVLERYPNIRIYLSHGGGFLPYQQNRFIHGWRERDEPKRSLKVSPEASLNRFLFDTILHGAKPLEFLIGQNGADHVLLGSDYPFDMGQYDGVDLVNSLSIPDADKRQVLVDNARRLLKLS